MILRPHLAALLLVTLSPAASSARPPRVAPLAAPSERAALEWRPVAVRVVAVAEDGAIVTGTPSGPSTGAAVTVGPAKAALVCAASLATLRVRAESVAGGPAQLRFWRIQGAPGAGRVAIAESPTEVSPGTWLIEHPPGGPGEWLISAAAPARVAVEAVAERTGELVWELAAGALLEWIERGGPLPPLPDVPEREALERELLADAAIAAALRASDPRDMSLQRAAAAWRAAAALQRLAVLRAPGRPAFAMELRPRGLAGADPVAVDGDTWQRVRGPKAWELRLTGPGVAWISARHIGQDPEASLSITAAGRRLARERLPPPARSARSGVGDAPDPTGSVAPAGASLEQVPSDMSRAQGSATPATEDMSSTTCSLARPRARSGAAEVPRTTSPTTCGDDGDDAYADGPTRQIRLALAPGEHTYGISFAGDAALLRIRAGATNDRLATALRREGVDDLLRAARRALAGSSSPRAPLVDGLLALVDGRPIVGIDAPGGGPTLALTHAWLLGQESGLPASERRARARRLARAARAEGADDALAWRARAAGLDLLVGTDSPELARGLAGPRPEEAPAAALAELARQLDGPALPLGSPALALLERARRRAPHDPAVLGVYRDHWQNATRWAQLQPDEEAGPSWTWIEALRADPTRAPGSTSLWAWPNGPVRTIHAPRAAEAPARPALLRLYADMPKETGPGATLDLAVDDRRWRTLPLAPLEELRVAVPPGAHTLALAAPAGAVLWSSLPPAPARPPDARLLRMWSLRPAAPVRFLVPGAPTAVRVEVRSLDPSRATRATLTVRADAGPPRRLEVSLPAAVDPAVPLGDAPRLGGQASIIVPVDPRARTLQIAVASGGPDLAVSASLRAAGVRPIEQVSRTSAPPASGQSAEDMSDPPDALAVVARTSRDLLARPHDPELLLARAHALIDLDQPVYARADWLRLTERPLPSAHHASAAALAARLDGALAPGHIDLRTDGPVLISPALAVAGLDDGALARLGPIAAAARSRGPAAALAALTGADGHDPQAMTNTTWPADHAPARPPAALLAALSPDMSSPPGLIGLGPAATGGTLLRPSHDQEHEVPPASAGPSRHGLKNTPTAPPPLPGRSRRPAAGTPAQAARGHDPADMPSGPPSAARRVPAGTLASTAARPGAAARGHDPADMPSGPSSAPRRVPAGTLASTAARPGAAARGHDFSDMPSGPSSAARRVPAGTLASTAARPGAAARGHDPADMPSGPSSAARRVSAGTLASTAARPASAALAHNVPADMSEAPSGPAADALRASLLDAAGRPGEAARAWARVHAATGRWQAGLAGVHSALAALDGPAATSDGAGLAYGLALRVRPTVDTPAIHRLVTIASARSRWSRLIMTERQAATDRLVLPPRSDPPSPDAAVRAALLAPPWAGEEPLILRPGKPVALPLRHGATELAFDLWCRQLRPELGGRGPAVRFSLVGETLLEKHVSLNKSEEAALAGLPRDAGSIDIELDRAAPAHLCAVRLRRPQARADERSTRWHVARPQAPVEFAVFGPTTLEVETSSRDEPSPASARGAAAPGARGGPAGALEVRLARGDGPFSVRLDGPIEHAPSAGSVAPGRMRPGPGATRILTIADPGPHRVRLAATGGPVLVRLRQRLDVEARPGDRPPAPRPVRTLPLPDPIVAAEADDHPRPRPPATLRPPQRIGTPYAELHLGTDDLEDADDLRPRVSGVVRLGFARELLARRLWLAVEPELRPREDTALVAGGSLVLQAFFPRAGLRAGLSGAGLVQTEGTTPWSARGELRVDRPTWVAPRLQLVPGLRLAYRHQSEHHPNEWPRGELHPRVYQRYLEDHPLALRPGLDLRLVAWQDARVVVGADVVTNADVRSLDQVNLHAGFAGAPALYRRLVPEFFLDYEASIRLRDDDRSKTYLRSRILAGVGLGVWLGDAARLTFGVRDALYLSTLFPARNGLDLWLRLDLPFGRGLRDHGPFNLSFRAARERRLWRQEP